MNRVVDQIYEFNFGQLERDSYLEVVIGYRRNNAPR